ncbi:MAG: hypothetical protein IPI73_08200, partial [Betaproteobacteria bacterium]|nr:hypothetical protein [Betaproteobacteria bacterium]
RSDPGEVLAHLDAIAPALDIDGDSQTEARTDGMLMLRYLFDMRGTSLVQDATAAGATRSAAQIEAHLAGLLR